MLQQQSRRSFLAASALGGGFALAQRAKTRRPNIIWFMYDDLGSGGLGCYGQEKIRTPHSDRVAREGARFTACYAGGSVCAPSRSVLMSGLHLGHAPVRANAQTIPLRDEDVTVAEVLKSAGYATGHFGKWGLGDAGTTGAATRQGFDEFYGYLHQTHAHNYWPEYLRDGENKDPLPANVGRKKGTYSAPLIARRAEQFVDKHAAAGRPFYLFASPTLPHALFHPPDDAPYSGEPAWTKRQREYAAMVTDADAHLGRLLALLDKYGIADNTVVFVTSDNGGPKEPEGEFFETNRGLRGYKGSLNEGGLRVPMIVRWPGGGVKAGRVDPTPWYFADFLPTAAAIAGAKTPTGLDGVSMVPVLTGKGMLKQRPLYWEQSRWESKTGILREAETLAQAVRLGEWKAIRSKPGSAIELYNLARDPKEERDVAGENPKVVSEIEAILRRAHSPARPHNNGNPEWVGRKDIPPASE